MTFGGNLSNCSPGGADRTDVDAAVAELRELTARAPETAPPPDRDSRGGGDGDDDAWYDRPYLEPL